MSSVTLGNRITTQRFIREYAQLMLGTKKGPGTKRSEQNEKITLFSIERRVLVKLVNKHKPIIKKKFPGINMKDVVDYVELNFREAINKNLSKYKDKVVWHNTSQTIVEGLNFRTISDITTDVRKYIREKALRNINTSTNKLERRKELSSGIIIGGLDVRQSRSGSGGGDIGSKHVKVDRANGIFELAEGSGQELARIARKKKQGFDVGHAFGPGIGNIIHFVGKGEKRGHEDPAITAFLDVNTRQELIRIRESLIGIDASIILETKILRAAGAKEGTITITMAEFGPDNQLEGALSRKFVAQAQKLLKQFVRDIGLKIESSPTIMEQYKFGIIELFQTGKTKKASKSRVKRAKTRVTKKIRNKVYGPGLVSYKDGPQGRATQVASNNIQQIIDLVNSELEDKIRENMGKGNSKQKLNWRTGRFGKSALLQNLIASKDKNALLATVKYHGPPYTRFEKGGDLYKPGRDPKRIFGVSIKQILKEQKIATLRRVKVNLRYG